MSPSISAFFPVLNEEETVERLTRDLIKVLEAGFDPYEVIIVDDGSTDRTGPIADSLQGEFPERVRVIHRAVSSGYGGALRAGFAAARYDLVFYTDGDYQFDLADLPRAAAMLKDNDMVIGYRVNRKDNRRRIFFSWGYNRLVRILFGLKCRDVDSSFKLFKTDALRRIPLRSSGYFIDTEILVGAKRRGLKFVETGVRHLPRLHGESKVRLGHVREAIREIIEFRRISRREKNREPRRR